jgi:hypothetical protein
MRILDHEFSISLGAKWPWTHFKVHKYEYYTHVVWGKISFIYGQPHLVPVSVCGYCYEEIGGLSVGDEGVSYCENCQQIEGPVETITTEEYEKHQNGGN